MNMTKRALALATPLALAVSLTACDDNNSAAPPPTSAPAPTPAPPPAPAPTPTPTPTGMTGTVDVSRCLQQEVAPGVTVANLVVPDTLTLDFSAPAGFPNGRLVSDPVANVTEAVILLDLTATTTSGAQQTALSFQQVPVDVPANDVAYANGSTTMSGGYPWLGAAQGTPPRALSTGTRFNFRSQPETSYVRVDRMGMPAVATALIGTNQKLPYNDANPAIDASGRFVGELTSELTKIHAGLRDDLISFGFKPCSTVS